MGIRPVTKEQLATKEAPRDPKKEPDEQFNEFCREPPCASQFCRRERRCVAILPPRTKVFVRTSMPWEEPDEKIGDRAIDIAETLRDLAGTVRALQADLAFMVSHTAILIRSNNSELRMVFNTERGQSMPEPSKCVLSDGVTLEFQNIGMPQVNVPTLTMKEIVTTALEKAFELGLRP